MDMRTDTNKQDIAYTFAEHIADTRFDDLPPQAVTAARNSILDTLGVMVGASGTTPALKAIVELVKEAGGRPESTIVAFGGTTSAIMAAFVNGAMAHCLDYEDIEYDSTYHPSSAVVPAGFAVAEKIRPVAGPDFINAVALGQDLGIRLALSIPARREPPWHRSAVIGAFAGAATAARLLNLDAAQIVDAFGITLCQAAGSMELRWSIGHDLGSIYAAFPAKTAVLSALLAQKGVKGIKNCLEGAAGLFNLYFQGEFDREGAVADLGKIFRGADTALKPWPSCAGSYTAIDSTIRLVKENAIRPQDIDRIVVYYGDYTRGLCKPLAARQKPESASDAKYSIPYCVAVAVLKGNVAIDDFTPQSMRDPTVLQMARNVTPIFDENLNIKKGLPAGVVEIKTKQGRTYNKRTEKPYGHPSNPLPWEEIQKKFKNCLQHSVKPISEERCATLTEIISELEKTPDVARLTELLG